MSYIDNAIRKPPKSLTDEEQKRLLKATGEHVAGFRDHVIYSVALGSALREHEIAALDVADVSEDGASVRRRFPLRVFKRSNDDPDMQEAIFPDALRYKLDKFLRWKKREGESVSVRPDEPAPLFVSLRGLRISERTMRHAFGVWQERAGFERKLTFHALRHTCLMNLYRSTKDIRLVQRVARHANIISTTIYAGPSDEDVLRAVRSLPC